MITIAIKRRKGGGVARVPTQARVKKERPKLKNRQCHERRKTGGVALSSLLGGGNDNVDPRVGLRVRQHAHARDVTALAKGVGQVGSRERKDERNARRGTLVDNLQRRRGGGGGLVCCWYRLKIAWTPEQTHAPGAIPWSQACPGRRRAPPRSTGPSPPPPRQVC